MKSRWLQTFLLLLCLLAGSLDTTVGRGEVWTEGESYTPMPGHHHLPFEIVAWGSDGDHLVGFSIYKARRHRGDRPLGTVRGLSRAEWFCPNVTFQISQSWDGPWRTLGKAQQGRELLAFDPTKGYARLRVNLDAFKPYVEALECGRIVLESGETATVGLKGLVPPSQRRERRE